jgi:phosphatidylglycerophosphate synthase
MSLWYSLRGKKMEHFVEGRSKKGETIMITPKTSMDGGVDEQPRGESVPSSVEEPHPPTLPAGSIYSEGEALVLGPSQRIRQRLLSPVACVLALLGIHADVLSFVSVIFGLGFFLLAPFYFAVAFWLLIASIICDGLDGVEARFSGTNNARGSLTDMFCDQTVVAFSVAGLAWKGLLHPVLALLYIYIYTALAAFLVLHRLLRVSSWGIVRPSRMVFFAAIALYFFFHINLLNDLLIVYVLAFPLLLLSFWRVRKAL